VNTYHPTIWRTCRVLANPNRLHCLKAVLTTPGAAVGEIAALCGLPHNQACLSLRALQARGLIRPVRESRWVRYHPQADPLVPSAAPILCGISEALLAGKMPDDRVIRCLTAFTHPRRLTILALLHLHRGLPFTRLSRESDVSPAALARHLDKLRRRGLVEETEAKGWALLPPPSPLAAILLEVLLKEAGQSA
jgi:DNA-binding transcriptional ArsR family regulator